MSTVLEMPDTVPDAVRKDAEGIEDRIKEFRARGHRRPTPPPADAQAPGTDGNPPDAPTAAADAAQTTQTTPAETEADKVSRLEAENAAYRRRAADLQRQVDVANGKFGGTIQGLKANIVDLQREIADLKTRQPTQVDPGENSDGKPWLRGISEEALEKYGEQFFEQAWRANRAEFDALRAELKKVNESADERVRAVEDGNRSNLFIAQVETLCPGATAINGNPSTGLHCAEGWSEFLDTPVPNGGGLTRRQAAEHAAATSNAPAFAAIVIEFNNSRNPKPTPQRQDVRSEVVPVSVRGHMPPQTGKRKIPQSEITAWSEKCGKAPPGSISAVEVDSKMREYADARREGRVYRD